MCQSKAEGGRRCNAALLRGVETSMTTYAATVTGLAPTDAKQAYADLHDEGARLPDPTREEVDEFLTHQQFQIRHDANIPEPKRVAILARIHAAIGRILPDGATFHAWKNIVAEAWTRARRKAAAAFLVGALTFGVGACGNAPSSADPTEPNTSPTPTAPAVPGQVDTGYSQPAAVTVPPNIARRYGADQGQAVYQAATVIAEETFREDLLANTPNRDLADLQGPTAYMTPSMKNAWAKAISDSATTTDMADEGVQVLTFHDVQAGSWAFRTDGPKVVNKTISRPSLALQEDGRIGVTLTVTGDLRITENDKPLLLPVTKTVTYYMQATKTGGNTTWLLDGYHGTYLAKDAIPDAS